MGFCSESFIKQWIKEVNKETNDNNNSQSTTTTTTIIVVVITSRFVGLDLFSRCKV